MNKAQRTSGNDLRHLSPSCTNSLEHPTNLRVGVVDCGVRRSGHNHGHRCHRRGGLRDVADGTSRPNVKPLARRRRNWIIVLLNFPILHGSHARRYFVDGKCCFSLLLPRNRYLLAHSLPGSEQSISGRPITTVIQQPETCDHLRNWAPNYSARAQFGKQFVMMDLHPIVEPPVRPTNVREQSVDPLSSCHVRSRSSMGVFLFIGKRWREKDSQYGAHTGGKWGQWDEKKSYQTKAPLVRGYTARESHRKEHRDD
jgi:hypothetical protein